MSKESVYDAEIAPLMTQILEICKREKIALIADFGLNEDLHCTSALLEDEFYPSDNQLRSFHLLKPQPAVAMAETTQIMPDGSKKISLRML